MLIRRAEKTVRNTRNLDFLHKINIEQRFHGNVAVTFPPKSIEFFFFLSLFPSQVTKHNFIMEQQDFYILAVALKGS